MPPYSIDYYQVNVGDGDCEIILLLDNQNPEKLTIKKAVLVDGGNPEQTYLNNIKQTFKDIREKFDLQQPLQFDAIIITCEDDDHYAGVFKLMSQDMDKGTGRVSWLKYTDNDPISILYLPYRFPPDPKFKVAYASSRTDALLSLDVDGALKALCKVVPDRKDLSEPPNPLSSPSPVDPAFKGSRLIGRELFSNTYDEKSLSANSPTELINIYKSKLDNQPGLFCVVANYQYLPAVHFEPEEDPDANHYWKCSVVCLVIWPDPITITHYLAGNAPSALENAVIQWTGITAEVKSDVKVVKASGHGSRYSSPSKLFTNFKPTYVFCSAGPLNPSNRDNPNPSELIPTLLSYTILISSDWEFFFKLYSFAYNIPDNIDDCCLCLTNEPPTKGFEVEEESIAKESELFKSLPEGLQSYRKGFSNGKDYVYSSMKPILEYLGDENDCFPKSSKISDVLYNHIRSPPGGIGRSWQLEPMSLDAKTPQASSSSTLTTEGMSLLHMQTSPTDFYITSSFATGIPPGALTGEADAQWTAFVGALPSGYIMLSQSPGSTPGEVKLQDNDPWRHHADDLMKGQVFLSVVASLNGKTVKIDGFKLSVTQSIGSKPITFESSPSETVGPPSKAPNSFNPNEDFLRFSLKPSDTSTTISLWDLIPFYRFPDDGIWFKSRPSLSLQIDHCDVWQGSSFGNYKGTLRLQASIISTDLLAFAKCLEDIPALIGLIPQGAPNNVTVVVRRTLTMFGFSKNDRPKAAVQLSFALHYQDVTAAIFCSGKRYLVRLQWKNGALQQLEKTLKAMKCKTGFEEALAGSKITKSKSFDILGFSVEIRGSKIFQVSVDACLKSGKDERVSFLLIFAYPPFLFRANLLTEDRVVQEWETKMPDYEELLAPAPPTIKPGKNLTIADLCQIMGLDGTGIPSGIPSEITRASFQLDDSSIVFGGTLTTK